MNDSTLKCSPIEPEGSQGPTLLVFADDWGRHPSSCQHLVRELLPKYRVFWVNTIGMRAPRFDRLTFVRAAGKFRSWFLPSRPAGANGSANGTPNPTVLNPKMWPWFRGGHDRWINRQLLLRQLAPTILRSAPPVVAITTVPIVADLVGRLPVQRWIYYCVDDFSQWPGLDGAAIDLAERCMVRAADVRICVSEHLRARLAGMGRSSELLTHGVDPAYWGPTELPARPPELRGTELPLVLFWGVIDRRMDTELVHRLAGALDRGTVVLLGPLCDADPRLFRHPRVRHVPGVPMSRLPEFASQATVLVMPYADLPVTRAIQPLKLKEYMATGKPVVVRDLPANRAWCDALDLAATPEEFSSAVLRRLATGLPPSQGAARERLCSETWKAKASLFEQVALSGARV